MNKHFRRGLAKGVPIAIGYMPIAIAYGVLSSVYGMPAWFVLASSAIVYAGSAQFMAANLMITGTGVWEIILTTLLVNSRNLLLAAGLAHNLEAGATKSERLAVGSLTTDELFSVALLEKHQALPPAYVIGIGLSGYLSWVVGTAFGIGLTDLLPPALASSMGIGLYAMFLGLLVPALREQPQARLVTLIAVTMNLLLYALATLLGIGHGLTIFIATVSAVALVTAAKKRLQW